MSPTAGTSDTMDFRNSAGTTRLNLTGSATDLNLGADFVIHDTIFNATIKQTGSVITVTLGPHLRHGDHRGATARSPGARPRWRPTSSASPR